MRRQRQQGANTGGGKEWFWFIHVDVGFGELLFSLKRFPMWCCEEGGIL